MSFAKKVKEELCTIVGNKEEQLAELAALLQLNTELQLFPKALIFKTNNPTIARRFLLLIKSLYKVESTSLSKQTTSLKNNQQIHIGVTEDLDKILSEHDILTNNSNLDLLIQSSESQRAYLRGVFLACGSVNDPKTAQYHLELFSNNSNHIVFIQACMNQFGLNAKITNRRKGYIAYLKDVEGIEDFLRIIGANQTVFLFEDLRIKRDFNSSITRIMNVELANEKKAISAANAQIEDINLVLKYRTITDQKLKQIINIRLEYPESSLNELVEIHKEKYQEVITKSGINHRLVKIKQLANEIRSNLK